MIDGIGIDVVNISRMASLSSVALHRLFHAAEIASALQLSSDQRNEYLAGRFAAKEALGKALGSGMAGFSPSEVCVNSLGNGKPVMELYGKARDLVGERMILLSISHDDPVATAIVLLQETC
ncbi:holo-ACP synthase [uncultured Sphaerochaeta sp.]|uniref:holo-ACP synthase n=1 Tax=uncultured Sphaerochaeta sp. TaxID=886478 RepID=UPI002A0A6CBC|nr:holo-ACP synthase [uncultured Sphaerochaeta sp.]